MSDFTPPKRPDDNPFAAPEVAVRRKVGPAGGDLGDAEVIRRKYLSHEASVRAIGFLNLLGGVMFVIGGIGAIVFVIAGAPIPGPNAAAFPRNLILGVGILYAALGVLSIAVGSGLRRLQNWARITISVLTGLSLVINGLSVLRSIVLEDSATAIGSLFGAAIGSLIPFYILYLMMSEKGKMVCSPEYAAIRAQTPHIKYRISCIVKWALILLFLFIGLAVVVVIVQISQGNFPPRPPQ